MINRQIIVATAVLIAIGGFRVLVQHKGGTLTKVLVGAYGVAIIASILDLFGSGVSQVVGAVMLLAAGTAVFVEVGDVIGLINTLNRQGA